MECPFAQGDKRLEIGNQYQPFEQEGMRDFFQMAAIEAPVAYNEHMGYYIVTRKKDIEAIMRDQVHFSASIATSAYTPVANSVLEKLASNNFCPVPTGVNAERPAHPRIRQIVNPAFDKKAVARMEDRIIPIVEHYVAQLKGRQTIDMVKDFSFELPAAVICMFSGIDEKYLSDIKRWSNSRVEYDFGRLTEAEQLKAADNLIEYWHFCEHLVKERIDQPKDDYISYLLEKRGGDDSVLTLQEIASLQYGVLLAGHETTTNMTANAVYTLMHNRDAWEAICQDSSLIPNTVEECLRLNGSVVCWRRIALEDKEFQGTVIPKGSKVLLALAGGNLDESAFDHPNQFDIHRKNAKHHLTFGHGRHKCLGAEIARKELIIILEKLTQAFPHMSLVDNDPLTYTEAITFRGPQSLMINLNEVRT